MNLPLLITFSLIIACQPDRQNPKVKHISISDTALTQKIDSTMIQDIKTDSNAPKGVFRYKQFNNMLSAEFFTNFGKMVFELYPEKKPLTVENFVNLSKRGFYNNNEVVRLIEDFIVQSGDKTNTGYGDAGYYFKTEHHEDLSHNRFGMLSMANHDSESNSSQYFITLSAQPQLDERHPVFGMIISGHDVLRKIAAVKTDDKDRPLNKIIIKKIVIKGL